MARYGSKDLKIEVDNSGGTPVDISAYVTTVGGFTVEAILEDSTVFSAIWATQAATGNKQVPDVTLTGFYDDTASTGPNALFAGAEGDTRTLKFTWGGTKTSSVEAIIKSYARNPQVKTLTKFTVVLTPTGAVTEV